MKNEMMIIICFLARSPIFSHANATLHGLTTIRALKAEKKLTREFHDHQNLNISASFMYLSTTRAFCLWLEMVCVLYVATVTMSFLLFDNGGESYSILFLHNYVFVLCQNVSMSTRN